MTLSQVSERGSVANHQIQSLLNEHDVARITSLSIASVRRWRVLGQGPRFLKIGASVRYRPDDIAAYLNSRPSGGAEKA
jgi:hypothetical protein